MYKNKENIMSSLLRSIVIDAVFECNYIRVILAMFINNLESSLVLETEKKWGNGQHSLLPLKTEKHC